jgi:hypothetical protein
MSSNEKLKEALAVVVKMVDQWCSAVTDVNKQAFIDSGAYSANAAAMRLLAQHGLMSIKSEYGRRVIAKWTDVARDFGADLSYHTLSTPRAD